MPKNTKTAASNIENSGSEDRPSFDTALSELESLVQQMESDQMPLEQSLAAYKRGTDLLRFCQKTLADVEQQVRILDDKNQLQTYTDSED
ncbi:exodeoxyribonuclease VII small subunit [Methyloradius palustris]|uniref:Exodeoxyribonuclease 7 small subunit n=1 Tax=Methyloradius palustris TaxID=2778876 RepID=A0A8D5JRS7_9PROT|nr:exodeoxyribonuclease VII small subunit [Methyloradius palustris]BCM25766.1 exodeoxyribonuclease 7 small subunit [Methyloradius palustris]